MVQCDFGNYSIEVSSSVQCMFHQSNNPPLLFVLLLFGFIILAIFFCIMMEAKATN